MQPTELPPPESTPVPAWSRAIGAGSELLAELSVLAAGPEDPAAFAQQALSLLLAHFQCKLGILWLVSAEDRLTCAHLLDNEGMPASEFVEVSRSEQLKQGEGLPGQCWQQARPICHADISKSTCHRAAAAASCRLRSAVAFPLIYNGETLAVIELIGNLYAAAEPAVLNQLRVLGLVLGAAWATKSAVLAERLKLQHQLSATAEEAMRSAALKTEFVANVSHEIRTPLAGILGMAELLSGREESDQEERELAGYILTSAQSLLGIVNDLLDFSKLETGKLSLHMDEFVLRGLVEEAVRTITPSARKKNLNVTVEVEPRLPASVIADRARLLQVLLNFAGNAVKFTERGEITVSAQLHSTGAQQVKVKFSVTDTGIGIKHSCLPLLFQPFVQVDGSTTRRYGGTGLGLSIAKKLTELMSGEVGVNTEPGKGSTFWAIVPVQFAEES